MELAVDNSFDELRRLTEILAVKDEYESGFLRGFPFPVWVKIFEQEAESFRMVAISDKYTEVFGITADEYLAKLDKDVWPKEIASLFYRQDSDVMETGKEVWRVEPTPLAEDPKWKVCMTMKFPITNNQGKIIGVGGVAWPYRAKRRL